MAIKIVQKPKQHNITFQGSGNAQNMFKDLGMNYKQATIKRTKEGKDVNGRAFTPYSPNYAKAKAEGKAYSNGRRSKGKDTSRVDLELGGNLLKAIQVEPHQTYVKVYPTEDSDFGYYHNEGLGVPKREWWGINDLIRRQLLATFNRAVKIK